MANQSNRPDMKPQDPTYEALRKAKDTAEQYLNLSVELIFKLDSQGTITLLNDSGHKLLGYSPGELIGRNWFETCLPHEIKSEIWAVFQKLMSGDIENVSRYENEVITKNGDRRLLLWHNTLLRDDDGEIIGIMGSAHDITEAKQAEMELIRSQQHLRDTSRIAKVGGWEIDFSGNTLRWTAETFRIHEVPEDKTPDVAEAINYYHPDDQQMVGDLVQQAIETGTDFDFHARLVTAKNNLKWVRAIGTVSSIDGEKVGLHGTIQDVTELKVSEEENLFQASLLQAVEEAIVVTRPDGEIIFWNAFAEKLYGWETKEAIGLNIMEVTVPQVSEDQGAKIMQSLREGESWRGEFNVKHRDGRVFPAFVTDTPLFDDNQELTAIIGISVDITERKKAESMLQETNARHAAMIENIGDVIAIVGPDGANTYQSPNVEKWFGWTPKELLGDGWAFIHPDDLERVQKEFSKLLTKKGASTVEYRFRCKDGNYKWIEITAANRIDDPLIKGILLNYHDISERKDSEESLLQAKESLEKAQSSAKLGSWEMDATSKKLTWSKQMYHILEVEFDQEPSFELYYSRIHPDDLGYVQEVGSRVYADNEAAKADYRLQMPSGEIKEISTEGYRVIEDGVVVKLTGIVQDITERKLAEEELAKHREHLEELVDKRTTELQEQNLELTEQRKVVEEANRLKSEFLTNMSHELRTPLNSIMSLSSVLAKVTKDRLTDEENHYLEVVERNGTDLLALINDILDLSKIESGESEIFLSKISLGQLLGTINDNLTQQAKDKGLELNLKVPEDLSQIVSDEQKLYQVLLNIAGNAVKFTEAGSVSVIVKNDAKNVYVDIEDTGIGISEDALPHIFDEFRQVDGSTSRKYEGTGLGLAIAYKTIKLLCGKITVKSTLGKGSVFTVTIPIKWAGEATDKFKDETVEPKPSNKETGVQPTKDLKNVLVIEDNPDNMISVTALLKGKYNILESFDGEDGIKQAGKKLPDLILLDMILPGMAGTEVVKILKRDKKTRDIPVIALTASVMPQNKQTFLEAGCDDFIAKPIDLHVLLDTMQKWLE